VSRLRYDNAVGALGQALPIYVPGGLTADGSTPAFAGQNFGGSIQSAAFNPPAGSLIVAFCGCIGSNSYGSVTDNQATHLTWTLLGQAHAFSNAAAEIYIAWCPTAITGLRVTYNSASTAELGVLVLNGAASNQTGAVVQTYTGAGSAQSASLTTTRANSAVVTCCTNWNNASQPSPLTGNTMTMNGNLFFFGDSPLGGGTYDTITTSNAIASGTAVTAGTSGGGGAGGLVVAEIYAAAPAIQTNLTFAVAPAFATLAAGDYVPLIIDPPDIAPNAAYEVVHLTSYTAAATSGTVARGQEGTSPVAHLNGALWVCGPTSADASNELSLVTALTGLTTGTETAASLTAPGSTAVVYALTVNQPCRVRLYANSTLAAADIGRSQNTDPTGDHGLLIELVFLGTGTQTAHLTPEVLVVNQNSPRNASFSANVRCDSGTALSVTLAGVGLVP
jgi:hypothetical protein